MQLQSGHNMGVYGWGGGGSFIGQLRTKVTEAAHWVLKVWSYLTTQSLKFALLLCKHLLCKHLLLHRLLFHLIDTYQIKY